jgi:hypothetical protein
MPGVGPCTTQAPAARPARSFGAPAIAIAGDKEAVPSESFEGRISVAPASMAFAGRVRRGGGRWRDERCAA